MTVVAGPFFAAAGLLGAAGVLKLARPGSTAQALRSAHLSPTRSGPVLDSPWAGRLLGLAEVLVACAALVFGGRVSATLVAASYLGFALFTARLLHTAGPGASCGCFGAEESPAAPVHVVVNGAIAVVGGLAVGWPTPGLAVVLGDQPVGGVPFLALTVACGWLLFVMLTLLPELQTAMAEGRSGTGPASSRRHQR